MSAVTTRSPSPLIRAVQVARGIDVADSHIVRGLAAGDLVGRADIPPAAAVTAQGGPPPHPPAVLYLNGNIQERQAPRKFLGGRAGTGVRTGRPDPHAK